MPKSKTARAASRARRDRKREREANSLAMFAGINKKKPPDILKAALAALHGRPLPNDPWKFNSVLENQEGTAQAEKFISIIRRTRRSTIVADQDTVQAVWDLCTIPWVRPLGSWKAKGKKAETKFRSLAAHLTCKYPTPGFLFSAFFIPQADPHPWYAQAQAHVPVRDRQLVLQMFEYLASGGSVRKAVREGIIPVAFTKKMCHEFMQAPSTMDVYEAIRYAQIKASGGSDRIMKALVATRLGRGLCGPAYEERLFPIIEWYCRQGMMNPDLVGPLWDYLEYRMQDDEEFNIVGRTVPALVRGMEAWHVQLNNRRNQNWTYASRKPPARFEPSGFKEALYEHGKYTWSVEEILTMSDLRTEGGIMRHCVSSYWHRIESGTTSIWSLQKDTERKITIEVSNGTRSVVQARGKCNKPPTSEENRFLVQWANDNRLRIRSI